MSRKQCQKMSHSGRLMKAYKRCLRLGRWMILMQKSRHIYSSIEVCLVVAGNKCLSKKGRSICLRVWIDAFGVRDLGFTLL